jgi:ubiquinone/menaquinone biosynthesis C-methylase UbiE
MDMRSIWPVLLISLALPACSGFNQLDYASLTQRAAWQRPDRVIEALGIQPGDHVVDLGSGEGYFLPYLVEAVGPGGRVTAVDVDEAVTDALQARVDEAGWQNVTVVLGGFTDPRLPDGEADLVLLVNTYHHIEDRPVYFSKLRSDLRPEGRVSVIDPDLELDGVLALTLDEGHQTAVGDLQAEMRDAGYREVDRFDFLPVQIFAIYASEPAES